VPFVGNPVGLEGHGRSADPPDGRCDHGVAADGRQPVVTSSMDEAGGHVILAFGLNVAETVDVRLDLVMQPTCPSAPWQARDGSMGMLQGGHLHPVPRRHHAGRREP
jgi:hypothetical protein